MRIFFISAKSASSAIQFLILRLQLRLPRNSSPNLSDGPTCMLRNKRFRICRGFLESGETCLVSNISQGDANVAQKATPFRAQDRSCGESAFELHLID